MLPLKTFHLPEIGFWPSLSYFPIYWDLGDAACNGRVCRGAAGCRYPNDAWELLMGYRMEKSIAARAGENLLKDLKAVDRVTQQSDVS